MSNIVFFYSGTGNSLAVALSIAEKLPDTKVVSILSLHKNKTIPQEYDRVGFVFPTRYSHASNDVLELVKDVRLYENQKLFLIATAGGACVYALSDMKKQLQPKIKNAIQEFFIPLPGSHIIGFSAYPIRIQNMLFKRAKKSIEKIAYKIQHDIPTKHRITPPNPKGFLAMQAKLNDVFFHVKDIYQTQPDFYVTEACEHCGICEKLCVAKNIKVSPDNVLFGNNCQQCMACIQWCPNRAIFHPNVTLKRKRYHHPDITLSDMLQAAKIAEQSNKHESFYQFIKG